MDLTGWNPWRRVLRMRDYQKRSLRMQVEIQYRCSWKWGGRYHGKGLYMTGVIAPHAVVIVRAGNQVDVHVSVGEATMRGTDEPTACLPLQFTTLHATKRKAQTYSDYIEIFGDGGWDALNAGARLEVQTPGSGEAE